MERKIRGEGRERVKERKARDRREEEEGRRTREVGMDGVQRRGERGAHSNRVKDHET